MVVVKIPPLPVWRNGGINLPKVSVKSTVDAAAPNAVAALSKFKFDIPLLPKAIIALKPKQWQQLEEEKKQLIHKLQEHRLKFKKKQLFVRKKKFFSKKKKFIRKLQKQRATRMADAHSHSNRTVGSC